MEYFELENAADRAVPTREVLVMRSCARSRSPFSPPREKVAEGRLRGALGLRCGRRYSRCFLSVLPATAAEEITLFSTNVTLNTDGSVKVTETITVTAEGDEIRRGIFRDIPTTLTNPDGSRLRSNLAVISVTRDGRVEPYAIERITNGVRIRIGDADVFLNYGSHRYVITYTMTRMARRFEDHDELFWNATGNYWNFPILRAVATVDAARRAP